LPQLRLDQFARVLDIGCGDAALWQQNRDRIPPGLAVTLCDLSGGMLRSAREALAGVKLHFDYVQANVQSLPFRPSWFDAVLANHMLYHVEGPAGALAELHRATRPGGFIFAVRMAPSFTA
jgi:ubiquinone/menaquinone biosynthesis C-methylase UbiE